MTLEQHDFTRWLLSLSLSVSLSVSLNICFSLSVSLCLSLSVSFYLSLLGVGEGGWNTSQEVKFTGRGGTGHCSPFIHLMPSLILKSRSRCGGEAAGR
jgi:hypothetical protein